jgi:hypothetical protein
MAPQEIVWVLPGGGWGSSPPRWKRIAFRKRSRFLYLHAIALIRCIRAFVGSAAALVVRSTTAYRIPSRCVLTKRAVLTIGSSLLREAASFSAQARSVRVHLSLSCDSRGLHPGRIDAGRSSHRYFVLTSVRIQTRSRAWSR